MTRQRLHASRAAASSPADDLTRLHGIGTVIQRRLHSAGIHTFAELAALSPDKIAALIPGLSAKRIASQGWILQARKLAPKKANLKPPRKETTISTLRQHYANFTVEFLLDEKNEARRTRVLHVQTGDAESWTGWEAEQLISFLTRHLGVPSRGARTISQVGATPKLVPSVTIVTKSVPEIAATTELVQPVTTPASVPAVATAAESAAQIESTAQSVLPDPVAVKHSNFPSPQIGLGGVLRLFSLEKTVTGMDKPQSILPYGQAFEVRLSLDLTEAAITGNPPLEYIVSIYAKNMSGGSYRAVGEAHGKVAFANRMTLNAGVAALPRGLYRLMAAVTLRLGSPTPSQSSGLRAWLDGGLLQVC